MKAKTVGRQNNTALMIILMGSGFLASVAPAAAGSKFAQTNLVSDIPGLAQVWDPNLVNAWGISESPSSPFWISDNGTGLTTLYSVPPSGPPSASIVPLVVTIPGAVQGTSSAPTGQVFNTTSGFDLNDGGGKALFLFASEDGAISGWNPAAGTNAIIGATTPDAVYKGLAVSDLIGSPTLYATNFHAGTIDVFNSSFGSANLPGNFLDPNLPAGLRALQRQSLRQRPLCHLRDAGRRHGRRRARSRQRLRGCVRPQRQLDQAPDFRRAR